MAALNTLDRNVQFQIGQKIASPAPGRLVDDSFFNIFCSTPLIRTAAISALKKMRMLALINGEIQLSNGKEYLRIPLSKLSGYLHLRRIIELATRDSPSSSPEIFTKIYLVSLEKANFTELVDILTPLKGIKLISLPYELENCQTKMLERLIYNNGSSLAALKHVRLPMTLPPEMMKKLAAINTSTLRNGTLEKEADFYAYYTEEASSLDEQLASLPSGEIMFRISINRHTDPFRAAIKAFRNGGRSAILSKITMLKFRSSMQFDATSSHSLLTRLAGAKKIFPNLNRLKFKLVITDSYPNNFPVDGEEDWEFALVSPLVNDSILLANRTLAWLKEQKFPFQVDAKVCLMVDYMLGEKEDPLELLESTRKQTKELFGQRLPRMEWFEDSRCRFCAQMEEEISPTVQYRFVMKYRTHSLSKEGRIDDGLFIAFNRLSL